ncbi:MAG: hypothetical protein ABSG73_11110 [Candidatus Aminicenantales bacterium]|jgi:hypothetical protein
MFFKIVGRFILCLFYLLLAYCFAYASVVLFTAPAVPCDDFMAKICSGLTLGRISACDCAAIMSAYSKAWAILFGLLAAAAVLACIHNRKPKKPSPSTQRIVKRTGTQPESWWHKYNGKEYNPLNDDYIIAGISSVQLGSQLGDVIEPVSPRARIETNRGEDLDCIIFRDGHVIKFTGFLGFEQSLSPAEAANKFGQYYSNAMNWFNGNPSP